MSEIILSHMTDVKHISKDETYSFHMAIKVKTPDIETRPISGLAIWILLDISSSMSGKKIETVKAAVKHIISELKCAEPPNFMSIIRFNHSVQAFSTNLVELSAENAEKLTKYVQNIVPFGATNIGDAIYKLCEQRMTQTRTDLLYHAMLFTDGQRTCGPAISSVCSNISSLRPNALPFYHVSINSYAIGAEPCMEDLRAISRASYGGFARYIEDSPKNIAETFGAEISDLKYSCAKNACIDVRFLDGCRCVKIDCEYSHDIVKFRNGSYKQIYIYLGNIPYDEQRLIMFKVLVRDVDGNDFTFDGVNHHICAVNFSAQNSADNDQIFLESDIKIERRDLTNPFVSPEIEILKLKMESKKIVEEATRIQPDEAISRINAHIAKLNERKIEDKELIDNLNICVEELRRKSADTRNRLLSVSSSYGSGIYSGYGTFRRNKRASAESARFSAEIEKNGEIRGYSL